MLQLQRRLAERYPHWFRGRRGRLATPLWRSFESWSRLDAIDAFLSENTALRGLPFVRSALAFCQVQYRIDAADLARIPASGRLLIVANHPSGALDALALLDAVGRVRADVRIIANEWLAAVPQLEGLMLPVRVFGGKSGAQRLRAIEQALRAGQCVIVFPAGEVSRLGAGGIRDSRWRGGFVHFARSCEAPVLPVRIVARNSALFYGLSTVFKPAGTALLAREIFERRNKSITLWTGQAEQIPATGEIRPQLRRIRRALYALGPRGRLPELPDRPAQPAAIAPAVQPERVQAAIQALSSLGHTLDGMQIRVGRLQADSPLLREIGRLRESTFRAVGEGTGRSLDLDIHDLRHEHIVLWDPRATRIAGAYRIARCAPVIAEHGLKGLYTASLFDYGEDILPRLAQGMELSRSFVATEYWGSRSIDYLWQGIGAYLRRHPKVRYLYGAVSISAALPVEAREQIVAYYSRFFGAAEPDASSRRPFAYRVAPPAFEALDAATSFGVLKANLGALGATVPMLYKQYTDLCEPGGAQFLAFGVDPQFSDCIDGLIQVDLQRVLPRKRRRYLEAGRMEELAA